MKIIHALSLAATLGLATTVHASTVDTFSFSQGGYTGAISPGNVGVLTGTFTGTVEANGTIQLADLSHVSLSYTVGATSLFGYGPATFFSFIPGSASTLDVESGIGANGVACIGAVAAFGFGQCGGGGVNGEVAGLDTTQSLATLTLVSSVINIPPQPLPLPGPNPAPQPQPPAVSPVPEPESLVLLGSAMLPLAWAARRMGARFDRCN